MSNIGVATEATSAKTIPVTREKLWSGGIVSVSIPDGARENEYRDGDLEIHYLAFSRLVKGGVINCFVHTTDNHHLIGNKITAEISVMRKVLADRRSYLYVDLRPVEDVEITHRLVIMTDDVEVVGEDWQVFKTPAPLRGTIVLAPPDAKISSAKKRIPLRLASPAISAVTTVPTATPPITKKIFTGEEQLDRLINDQGWKVDRTTPDEITLWKMKNGTRVTMIHKRMKKNIKRK